MRKFKITLLFLLLVCGINAIAMSPPPKPPRHRPHHEGRNVNTPLDGGLLSILGAAGIGYYLLRKKNSKKDL